MAGTASPIFPQTIKNWQARLLPATGAYTIPSVVQTTTTNLVALCVGDTNGDKIESLVVTSTDTAVQSLVLAIINATDTNILGVVTIPASSGSTAALTPIDILRAANLSGLAYDPNGNKYIYVPSGSTLYIGTLTAVTAAKSVQALASGGQF